jgi:ferrochelatase
MSENNKTGPETVAVLVMAYGGPDSLEDVEPYLLDVRGYRETADHIIEEVKHHYELIGGRSPIKDRTETQANQLRRALDQMDGDYRVFVGMRHWHPFIKETLDEILAAGLDRIVGLVLAPHYSRMSVQAYYDRLEEAIADRNAQVQVAEILSWNLAPGYLDAIQDRITNALQRFDPDVRPRVHLVFTAHSLPTRILKWEDPYPQELAETYHNLRGRFPDHESHFAYQSAAMTPETWLGPDAGNLIEELLDQGEANTFLVVPIGFVSEHVEILYDIDIELKDIVKAKGGVLDRIEMPGSAAPMMESLAELIVHRARDEGWL